jgi:hypothetical protein
MTKTRRNYTEEFVNFRPGLAHRFSAKMVHS